MAERRPITARDVKSNVEGYSEMSDEAFARRFYSDRAELQGLGVPLQSQRDEFTGEELYNLRSENYFLPELTLSDDEFAALQTSVYLLEGQFAYAEPLRLALQNLAAGRAGFQEALSPVAARRVRMSDPDYSPEMAGRLAKLETAYSKGRTVKCPEFLNRVDEIIMFQPLLKKEIKGIVKIQLENLKKLVAESGIQLNFSDYALEFLAEQGFDPQYGARPLKRLIQKEIVNTLSRRILAGDIDKSIPVLVDVFDNTVVFRNEENGKSSSKPKEQKSTLNK